MFTELRNEERTPKFVVFDTETTGLFLFRDKETGQPVPADDPRQPRMASFAAIICDEGGDEISSVKFFVQPDGWSIDGTKASEINGLTESYLAENGVPVSEILDMRDEWIKADLIVTAFNAQFDCKMMRAELRRAGREDHFEATRNICLMRALSPYGKEGLCISRGYVKLSEACEFFSITNENAHDAMSDTVASAHILKRLIADNRLPEAKVHYAAGSKKEKTNA
ncbi:MULTISPECIES: 3'-5' exonuclease [unclassified Mameliella]|uniref:3'-5' exonuclease n=1 Tax=unclassified Mameliella TaxID=2630630 RepID=UPI00273D74DC|nr:MULTISPECIES: 3'-5' exonuclease [unclassified Mameliella]